MIRNSRHSGKAFPDEARERGKVVRVTGAIVDVAKAPKFCKGQRRVDRPEFVGAFRDKAIDKDLPVPWPRRADVLDMEPDVRGAIAKQLVIPLRSVVELVGSFDVIEEKGSGPLWGRRNQVIEIDGFKPEIGAQPHDVALVADDVIELVLPVQTGNGRITLALLRPRFDRNANVAVRTEVEAHEGVANELWSPEVGEKIDSAQIRKLHNLGFPSGAEIGFAKVVEVSEVVDHDVVTVPFSMANKRCSRSVTRADAWIAVSNQRFRGLNCAKSRPNFYDAERLLLFGFATCSIGYARVSTDVAARRLFRLAADPPVAIRINYVCDGFLRHPVVPRRQWVLGFPGGGS